MPEFILFLVFTRVIRLPCWCTKQWLNVAQVLHNNGVKSSKEFFRYCSVHQHGRRDVKGKSRIAIQGPVSWKSRKLFGHEKPLVKLRIANFAKLVFSYVVKGKQLEKTAVFRLSKRLRFEDAKRIMSPETRPIIFGTFEKRVPGPISPTSERLPLPKCSESNIVMRGRLLRVLLALIDRPYS